MTRGDIRGNRLSGIGGGARRVFAAGLLLAALAPEAALAQAGTRLCRQLEAQLASLSGGGTASAQTRKYDDAIARQRGQMDKARGQARQAGCGFAVAGGALAFCGELNAMLARMEKNLSELQRQRTKLSGGDARRERARVMASLDINGCRAPKRTLPAAVAQQPREQRVIDGRSGVRIGGLPGAFRTMCVRACDGYYFPISYSVSSGAFERDGKACEAMCPGTRVELYYHRLPDEDSEDMVSVATGVPYREMKNAFLYRKPGASIPAACGCGPTAQGAAQGATQGFQTIGGDYEANEPAGLPDDEAVEETTTAAIPLPSTRPDPAEDPETLSTREGGLDAEGLKRLATPPPARPVVKAAGKPGEKQVRVVGPAFLPGPEEAIDLQAPAPARAR